jgi:hypothetical protein
MGRSAQDLTNQRFGRLVVIKRVGSRNGLPYWLCKCDCGNETKVTSSNLRGRTRSCGCLAMEVRVKHGKHKHPLYLTWYNMIRRSGNFEYGESYLLVEVCEEWKNSVNDFIKYVDIVLGPKPSKVHSIDRIDNNKGYQPGNIRWATKVEQSNNRKCVRLYTYKGETNTIRYFADKYGANFNTVRTRLWKGMKIWQALQITSKKKV